MRNSVKRKLREKGEKSKIGGFKTSITDGGDESMVDYILDHRRSTSPLSIRNRFRF
jgi:hypothetical protein